MVDEERISSEQARLISQYFLLFSGVYEQALTIIRAAQVHTSMQLVDTPVLARTLTSLLIGEGQIDVGLLENYSAGLKKACST
jgi:hypothetical protein